MALRLCGFAAQGFFTPSFGVGTGEPAFSNARIPWSFFRMSCSRLPERPQDSVLLRALRKGSEREPGGQADRVLAIGPIFIPLPSAFQVDVPRLQSAWTASLPSAENFTV